MGAAFAAAGIAVSRISGLVRERFLGQALGEDPAADALRAALRLPNFIQNLLGDTALSAAFTPVYAQLLGSGQEQVAEALRRLAAARLALALSLVVALGVLAAPWLVWLLAPGFDPERALLATRLVRILFPAAGLLVMSALALSVLQAQGRFLSGYASPILWNGAIVGALLTVPLWQASASEALLAEAVACGAALGAFLQWGWQSWRARALRRATAGPSGLHHDQAASALRRCLQAFPPVLASRGVVQVSAWVDTILASVLPVGSLAIMAYAQTLYLLPIALFGTSVSAAALPALSTLRTGEGGDFRALMARSERRLLLLGSLATGAGMLFAASVVKLVYGGGRFDGEVVANTSTALVCGMTIVLPSMLGRLYASAFFALERPAIATRAALLRVGTSITLSLLAVWLLELRSASGPAACAWLLLASGVGATAEAVFLRLRLARGHHAEGRWLQALPLCLLSVAAGALAGMAASSALPDGLLGDVAALAAYGAGFIAIVQWRGAAEERGLFAGLIRRLAGWR